MNSPTQNSSFSPGQPRSSQTSPRIAALRSKEFFGWVTDEWDLPGDNIYIWDLYSLQTEGSLYFKDEYAVSPTNSHPNDEFAGRVVKDLFNRIIDVVENNGNGTLSNGKDRISN